MSESRVSGICAQCAAREPEPHRQGCPVVPKPAFDLANDGLSAVRFAIDGYLAMQQTLSEAQVVGSKLVVQNQEARALLRVILKHGSDHASSWSLPPGLKAEIAELLKRHSP